MYAFQCILNSIDEQSMLFICHQVTVNGVDYQPQTASPNKKHAKAMAATVALQALGEVTLWPYQQHINRMDITIE